MRNEYVVKLYVAGEEEGGTTNLHIKGNKLFNYFTCLAQRLVDENGIVSYIVNETKYSPTTSAIQTLIRNAIPSDMVAKKVSQVRMGERSLN